MCPFDVSAPRRLERIIESSLSVAGWSWGVAPARVGLHIPHVNTRTEVGLPGADEVSKVRAQPASM